MAPLPIGGGSRVARVSRPVKGKIMGRETHATELGTVPEAHATSDDRQFAEVAPGRSHRAMGAGVPGCWAWTGTRVMRMNGRPLGRAGYP
jgi:hypothetical protein